jgi:V8-like Glu-specific endopeptidase
MAGASCFARGESREERVAASRQAIVGGSADSADTAVVALLDPGTGALCSGMLVAPSVVLTAAHCLAGLDAGALEVLVGGDSSKPDQTLTVARVIPYPTYDSQADGIPGGVDLGAVVLSAATSVTPIEVRTDTTDAQLTSAQVDVVGYGASNGATLSGSGTRRSVVLTVDTVCSRVLQAGGPDADACEGDSGGAVLLGGKLVAVVSGGRSGCASPTFLTRTDAHADWIRTVVAGGSPASCPSCVTPDPSCTAATETSGAKGDAGAEGGGSGGADGGAGPGAMASSGACAVGTLGGERSASAWLVLFAAAIRRRSRAIRA